MHLIFSYTIALLHLLIIILVFLCLSLSSLSFFTLTTKKETLYQKDDRVDPEPVFLGLSKLLGSSEEKSRQLCCALEQHGCFEPPTARGDLFSTSPLLYSRSRRCLCKYHLLLSLILPLRLCFCK